MKNITLFTLFALFLNQGYSQNIVKYREAILTPTGYPVTGKAFLEEYDNGDLKLRLDDDFSTSSGPDVQVMLNTDTTTINALTIEDIGYTDGIDHFSGTITWDIPGIVSIENTDYIIFHCVQYNVSWANGDFGPAVYVTPNSVEDDLTTSKTLIRVVNLQGQPRDANTIGEMLIFIYSDGSIEKKVIY